MSRNFSARGGGAERYSVALVQQLAQRHELHVFAQHWEQALPGIIYHRVPQPLKRPRWINQLYFAWATWRMTRSGFDAVHSHETSWHGDIQTVHVLPVRHNLFDGRSTLGKARQWLKVLTSPRLIAYLWLEACRYRPQAQRHIVLTSNTLLAVMQRSYPRALPLCTVVPPGVALVEGKADAATQAQARVRLGLPLGVGMLLFVGNDMRKKGLPALLQAMAVLPADLHLAVVGQSEQRAALQKAAAALGPRVHFLGSMADVADAYRAADCLVHPTLEDTYAMVVLEALAHGLPVVVSAARYCGIAAELQDGVNAIVLADPRAPEAIAAAVHRALATPALSAKALEFARHRTWQEVAARHEEMLHG